MSDDTLLYYNTHQLRETVDDFINYCNTRNYFNVRLTLDTWVRNNLNLETYIEELLAPCRELMKYDKLDIVISLVQWLYSKDYIDLDTKLICHIYSDLCIKGNVPFLQAFWYECSLVDDTYLMPHECFSQVFYECDPSIEILQTMISHMEESNEYNEEIQEYSDWLLCSALINGANGCARYLLNRSDMDISIKMVFCSIMGGNSDTFDLIYNLYSGNINRNKMLSIAAGYGGLDILVHLLKLFPLDDYSRTHMCTYALSRGQNDVLHFVCESFQDINYTTVLNNSNDFAIARNDRIAEYDGFFQEYEKTFWEVSTNWEDNYRNCLLLLSEYTIMN
jgi:hypothetical protein